jgi:hypothetical protein
MHKIKEKISWVLADSVVLDPTQDIEELKRVGAFWGSWRTWRAYQTDNVICHDQVKADELIQREFQKLCNFYIPESVNTNLNRPEGVKVYAGEFVHDVIRQEEIVAMHLAATTSDIVIMLGWDFTERETDPDRLQANQAQHYRNLVQQAFITYNHVQWVVVDHPETIMKELIGLSNLSIDTMENVLKFSNN